MRKKPSIIRGIRRPATHWIGVAAIALFAVVCAYAAPNPVSGVKPGEGFQTAAAHAILIEAESGSVLFEKAADTLLPPALAT